VAEISQHRLRKIVEKPIQQFFVNAGIYVLEPETLDCLTAGRPVDMPSLFNRLIEEGKEVVTFPIREYWLDIGELGDLKKANGDYGANFGCTSPVDDLPDGLKKG
jgi:NDP-sugar pyrophosphorylase family protein